MGAATFNPSESLIPLLGLLITPDSSGRSDWAIPAIEAPSALKKGTPWFLSVSSRVLIGPSGLTWLFPLVLLPIAPDSMPSMMLLNELNPNPLIALTDFVKNSDILFKRVLGFPVITFGSDLASLVISTIASST